VADPNGHPLCGTAPADCDPHPWANPIIAVGTGPAGEPIDAWSLGAFVSLVLSLGVWFEYFRGVAHSLEHALQAAEGRNRLLLGQQGFTYLHLAIIAGIGLSDLGAEQAMAHVDEDTWAHPAGGRAAVGSRRSWQNNRRGGPQNRQVDAGAERNDRCAAAALSAG
jgi:hypothetical protein